MADLDFISRCIYASLFSLSGLLSSFGNIISIIVLRKPAMHCISNRFLTSLAISDCLVGLIFCPFAAVTLIMDGLLADKRLQFYKFIMLFFFILTSIGSLGLIAYDRYKKLDPTTYRIKISDKRSKIMIAITWLFTIGSQLLMFLDMSMTSTLMNMQVIFCTVLVVYSYRKMVRKIKSDTKILNQKNRDEEVKKLRIEKDKKMSRKLLIFILVYFLCNGPMFIQGITEFVLLATLSFDNSIVVQHFRTITILALCFDSVCNPCIYMYANPKFRKLVKKMLEMNLRVQVQR